MTPYQFVTAEQAGEDLKNCVLPDEFKHKPFFTKRKTNQHEKEKKINAGRYYKG